MRSEVKYWECSPTEKAVYDAVEKRTGEVALIAIWGSIIVLCFFVEAWLPFDTETQAMLGAVAFFPLFFGARWASMKIGEQHAKDAVIELRQRAIRL